MTDDLTTRRGGVLLRYGDDAGRDRLGFIPADVATRVTALSARRAVPGLRPPAGGVALADGEVVTVLEVGAPVDMPPRPGADWTLPGMDRAVICAVGGHSLALAGGVIVATGVFEARRDHPGVTWRGSDVDVLDVRALYRRAEASIWEHRARGTRGRGAA